MGAPPQRARPDGEELAKIVGISGKTAAEGEASIPPRFERQLRGASHRRRGGETPWVAVAKVNGVAEIRTRHGDEAVAGLERLVHDVRELSGRDHRWAGGSLSVGVAPLWNDHPAGILERA